MTTETATDSLRQLEPRSVWGFFAGIAGVPRPSKREERIGAHVRKTAEQHRLSVREDRTGNLVIDVPASPGCERVPITVLQAHLDMVCEKNSTTRHDFDKEGIRLVLQTEPGTGEQILRGDGTTLGADNGVGVSLALAAATSPDVIHGPLELLFTIDEEDGMTGAKALGSDSFRGRRMLNLDSEEDDALYIGCAGGCDVGFSWSLAPAPLPPGLEVCRIMVTGLRGGHSGCEIHEGRANAIKLLVRTLLRNPAEKLQLVDITGGSKRNAIPREATAIVAVPAGTVSSLEKTASEITRESVDESFEPGVSIRVERVSEDPPPAGVSTGDTGRVLAALIAVPSSVLGMHPRVSGLVETSNNLSTIATTKSGSQSVIEVGMLSRSSAASRIRELVDRLTAIGRLAGAEVSTGNSYPGWSPNPDSPTLAVCRRVYHEMFGQEPRVAAIHAGLECGIIGERVGGMDMVSLGPTIRGAHSPDERVYVASVERTWRYLVALLAAFARA